LTFKLNHKDNSFLKEYENVSTYLPYIDIDIVRCIIQLYGVLQKIAMFFKMF